MFYVSFGGCVGPDGTAGWAPMVLEVRARKNVLDEGVKRVVGKKQLQYRVAQ